MFKFKVPEYYLDGFAILALLEEEEITKLVDAISSSQAGIQPEGFREMLSNKLSIPPADTHLLAQATYSLIQLRVENTMEINSLISDLVESFFEENEIENIEKKRLPEIKIRAAENLLRIFQADGPLPKTVKGLGLMSESDKVYLNNRIVTDLRLIFDSKNSNKIDGAVILHQLKLVYTQNGQEQQMFFSLDGEDLAELHENVLRAIEKEKFISQNNFSSNLEFIKRIR